MHIKKDDVNHFNAIFFSFFFFLVKKKDQRPE